MKWSVIKKLTAVFALALAVVVFNAVISYSNTIKLINNQQLVTSSYQVITQLENTLSTLKDAETIQRNYLITADASYLEAYFTARQKTHTNIQSLKKLTTNNPQKHQSFFLLEHKINNRFNIFEEELNLRKNHGFELARRLVRSRREKEVINDIRQVILSIKETEQKLLQLRIQQSQASSQRTITTFLIAAFCDLALVALLYYVLGSYITRLKQVEFALRERENRLQAMIDLGPECINLIARDGSLLEINSAGLAMIEVDSADEVIGKPVYSLILPEYREAFTAVHESVCQGNKGILEFEIIACRGTHRWMETHAVPLRNESDGTFLNLAMTRDITQRKQAEQKIREQAALLDVTTDAILVQNIQNQILFWNKGAESLYGWKVEEVVGNNPLQLLYQEISPQLKDALKTVVNKGEWQGELNQVQKDGKEIIVESRWTLVRDEKGQPKSILIVNTEITHKKQLEAQLLRSQRLDSIGTLAGGIAHDLNNVLAPVLMSIQLLQMKLHDEQNQQVLKTLENNVKRGANLIKQVLSFARGIEGKRTIIQVKHLIWEIKEIITETFPKSISCHIDIPENLDHVSGDITQLHQVLMNLVVNARDAMPNGGTLRISAENLVIDQQYVRMNVDAQVGSYIVITVADTGIGMATQIQERMFEPFFTTKELGKGTGLGLSTVIGIIKNHNGFVNVSSEVGKGTQFQVYLPAVVNHTETPAIFPELEPLAGDGELILVVDDEAAILEITKSSLEAYNYRVLTAHDGVEAVTIYAQYQQEISVVLLDIMMPSMDGTTTIRTLQKINPNVKIIAASGLLSNQKIAETSGIGVKAFLSKPCTAKELLQTISAVNRELGVRS